MTPKEKAQELVNKFLWNMPNPNTTNAAVYIIAKQCASIAVDEILSVIWWGLDDDLIYWEKVKKEIEAL